jgi:hypothetical protein
MITDLLTWSCRALYGTCKYILVTRLFSAKQRLDYSSSQQLEAWLHGIITLTTLVLGIDMFELKPHHLQFMVTSVAWCRPVQSRVQPEHSNNSARHKRRTMERLLETNPPSDVPQFENTNTPRADLAERSTCCCRFGSFWRCGVRWTRIPRRSYPGRVFRSILIVFRCSCSVLIPL